MTHVRPVRTRARRRAALLTAPISAAALMLAACGEDAGGDGGGGGDGGEAVDSVTIGWTPPDITGVFQTATNYFEQAAEEAGNHGIDVTVQSRSPATHTDYADQLAIVEDFITQQVDVIAISPADTQAILPAIQQANSAGIPVIIVNLLEELEGVEVATYIGFSNSEAAEVSGYAVLDYYGGPGVLGDGETVDPPEDGYLDIDWWRSVYVGADLGGVEANGVIIEGIAGSLFSNERNNGFNAAIEEASGVEILAQPIAADWNREMGTSAAEDFLSRFGPDQLDFIYASSNEMGMGAAAAASQRGRLDTSGGQSPPEEGRVAVFTNDVTPESVDMIREGRIVAETHHGFAEWGWLGTASAVRLACGSEVERLQDIRPRTVYEGNADMFYPDLELPEIDWDGIAAECGQ
ncbi:sugar ABC transporter substrate-binding protein [Georgenia alba]|uniref:Sugar ABC transporter substrate-binding protein n=1 Tax=Georgenia alba TaxID=2233858 RepID=A0ABW2Q553_9MICO